MAQTFDREIVSDLNKLLLREPNLIQIVVGPRHVGKTTAAQAVAATWEGPTHYAAADQALPPGPEWIIAQWDLARRQQADQGLLILDEVQKVAGWSETVKALWDEDRISGSGLRVVLLGSSALLLARGMTESMAGRFFLHRCTHWSFGECQQAFGWDLERWLYFGGYPAAARLTDDEQAWRSYVTDSLIETVLSRDVLAMETIRKPALLRQLFALAARDHAQIRSFNKMLGQLQDAGNTTTLAHYLRLLDTAFLATGLERFSGGKARRRGSSPKLILWNNALVTALNLWSFDTVRRTPEIWGRLVENAVGAHLLNHLRALPFEISSWRKRQDEVDYVIQGGGSLVAVEVKSGGRAATRGLGAFLARFKNARPFLVGQGGMKLETFFTSHPAELL